MKSKITYIIIKIVFIYFFFFFIHLRNDQEYELLTQKHNEEISLYQIQLNNSSKTIIELQDKLNAYQTKRFRSLCFLTSINYNY